MSADDRLARSRELHERASRVLAGGVSTAFRAAERPLPIAFQRAAGAHLLDVDGNDYVDYACGYGPVILGHGDPRVTEAAAAAAGRIQQVGGQHELEVELAERLCRDVPSYELVRLAMSGSEAIHAAVRAARAATGRPLLVKFAGHYHGWLDGIYSDSVHAAPAVPETAGQSAAALGDVAVLPWNDADALDALLAAEGERVAAVIMEPLPCNHGVIEPRPGYLEHVRAATAAAGAALIFDEVITGFRLGTGGEQSRRGVTPDLTVTAKAMANGFPIAAFGGRRDLMEAVAANRALHAGTYNGGGASVAAAIATIDVLAADGGALLAHTTVIGRRLIDGLRAAAERHGVPLVVEGPGPVFFAWLADGPVRSYADHLASDRAGYAEFAERMLLAGVRTIPAGRWYVSAAHTDLDVERALEAADGVLAGLAG